MFFFGQEKMHFWIMTLTREVKSPIVIVLEYLLNPVMLQTYAFKHSITRVIPCLEKSDCRGFPQGNQIVPLAQLLSLREQFGFPSGKLQRSYFSTQVITLGLSSTMLPYFSI